MVTVKHYGEPPVDRREILRYARADVNSDELDGLIDSCLSELLGGLSYSVCYAELPVSVADGEVVMGSLRTRSESFGKYISECKSVIVFAATIGLFADRLIKRYSAVSPSRALMLDAIGAERIESLCDVFCEEIKTETAARGQSVKPRFSAGYGDLPLSMQKDIFDLLGCEKRIGLCLSDSLLMTPTKSVTAFVGVR